MHHVVIRVGAGLIQFVHPVCLEHTELPAKLLDYFLQSNKSNINQMFRTCAWPRTILPELYFHHFFRGLFRKKQIPTIKFRYS